MAILVAMIASCSRPLDDDRLAATIDELDSAAAEAELLAELPAPDAYAREQRGLLAASVAKTRDELTHGVRPAREPLRAHAHDLALALELAIRAGGDTDELHAALAHLAAQARQPVAAQ